VTHNKTPPVPLIARPLFQQFMPSQIYKRAGQTSVFIFICGQPHSRELYSLLHALFLSLSLPGLSVLFHLRGGNRVNVTRFRTPGQKSGLQRRAGTRVHQDNVSVTPGNACVTPTVALPKRRCLFFCDCIRAALPTAMWWVRNATLVQHGWLLNSCTLQSTSPRMILC
jgi:hypothetical protein